MPTPALIASYWLHLLATVIWLGGLAMLVLAAWQLRDASSQATLDALERRFHPWGNVSLAVLIVTGLIQMGGDSHYEGLLIVRNPWSVGLLAKHVVIGGMVAVSVALQWGIYPALERARLLAERSPMEGATAEAALRRRLRWLMMLNLGLGVLVLALTAAITAF